MIRVSGALAKATGAVGLGLLAYDAHHAAKDYGKMYSTKKETDNIEKMYYDTLSLEKPSRVKDRVKKGLLNFEMDNNIDSVAYKIGGYVKEFAGFMCDNVIPLGLSAGALLTKGALSKASAIGLVGYAVVDLLNEIID